MGRAAQTLLVLFSVDDLTGFELTRVMELPDPWGLVAVWGFVLPVAYLVSSALTNLVLRDFLILKVRRPRPSLNCTAPACVWPACLAISLSARSQRRQLCAPSAVLRRRAPAPPTAKSVKL